MISTDRDVPVYTVGIRLQAPMQSWANAARGAARPTHVRPTKAGVMGLIANALGRDWTDPIGDLAALRFGVRVDQPGTVEVDYHTTGGGQYYALPTEVAHAPSWWGNLRTGNPADPDWMTYAPTKEITADKSRNRLTSSRANTNITNDYYLADASFLAAVEGTDQELMQNIAHALAVPARALFLGRKAYGPTTPLLESATTTSIEELFETTAAPVIGRAAADPTRRGVIDAYVEPHPGDAGVVVHDQPVTFNGPTRRAARRETHYTIGNNHAPDPKALNTPPVDLDQDTSDPTLFDTVFEEGTPRDPRR